MNFFEQFLHIVACLFLKLKVRVAKQRQRIYTYGKFQRWYFE